MQLLNAILNVLNLTLVVLRPTATLIPCQIFGYTVYSVVHKYIFTIYT